MDSDATGCECFPEPSRAIRLGDSMIPPLSGRCNTIWKHDYNLIIVKFLDHLFIYLRTRVKFQTSFKVPPWFHFIPLKKLIFRQAWGSSLRGLEISQLSISMTEFRFQSKNFRDEEILKFRGFFLVGGFNQPVWDILVNVDHLPR